MMDLSIITVTYQSKNYIDACILSVIASTLGIKYEHIIVDNHSTDGTVEFLQGPYASYIHLIKNPINRGFSAANNQALSIAKGRYILFLNPDMQICEGTLDSLLGEMDQDPKIGMLSCKLLTPLTANLSEGKMGDPHLVLQPIRFPKVSRFIPFLLNLRTFRQTINTFAYPSFQDDVRQEVDLPRGAFFLIRSNIVKKLGFAFDPRYFILFEDVDLCKEVKRLGYKIIYNPQVSCIDYFGKSFHERSFSWKHLHTLKSFQLYVSKWHHPLHQLWIYPLFFLSFLLRVPKWGLKNSLQALIDFRRDNTNRLKS